MNTIYAFKENWKAFVDGLIPSLVCILIVFIVLVLIMAILCILNAIKVKNKKEKSILVPQSPENVVKTTKMEDIVDEDMMVAVLIATIDYRQEVKQDVHLINVKQIG